MTTFSVQPTASNLELIARQIVEGYIIGLHRSPFHGFSVEFAEHRQYNTGDPIRHIDWKVYGRNEKLFVKKYEEETNVRCTILLDTSSSMQYPLTKGKLNKQQFGCIMAASLLQLFKKQLDAASLVIFNNEISYISECKSSPSHYKNLTIELSNQFDVNELQKTSNISKTIHQIADQIHRRSLVVIISDLVENDIQIEELFHAVQHMKHNKHEVILVHIYDKEKEIDFDFENRPYEFIDIETNEKIFVQPHQMKKMYQNEVIKLQNSINNMCNMLKIDRVIVDLTEPIDKVLHSFLLKRSKM